MASFVSAVDAVAAAVEIERRGRDFYEHVAERAEKNQDKEFFIFMAGEEQRHEGIFAAMLARLGGLTLPAGSDSDEYLRYVQVLLDSHALFLPDSQEKMIKEPLQEAMRMEKDTLIFFMALEEMVPESERKHVRECADEERRHMKMIAARMVN